MPSQEFLQEIWGQAKKLLPGWMYATLLQNARPASGGRASHRVDEPTFLEKLALIEIKPDKLKEVSDEDLRAIWLRLHQWFANAQRRKQAIENIVNAGLWVRDEIKRRKGEVKESELTEAIDALAKTAKARQDSVKGVRGEIPKALDKLLVNAPDEILLIRDFASIAGSAAVAEKPEDIDVIVRCEYDSGKGKYQLDGTSLWEALRRLLTPDKEGPQIQLVSSPSGSFTDYVPLYDLVARRREPHVEKIEANPPDYADKERVIKAPLIQPQGPNFARFAFVSASANSYDAARKELLVGKEGEIFQKEYLAPLGLKREEVLILAAAPQKYMEGNRRREPNIDEVAEWSEWLEKEISERTPRKIIALGKVADRALKNFEHITLPHPSALLRFGNSGEVARKVKRFKTVKALEEGGTRSETATRNWDEHWQDLFPDTGKGKFIYQHHWRGLNEDEIKQNEDALMQSEHSLHGDIRLEGNDSLWGFTIFLGETKDNRTENQDKLIDWKKDDNIEATPKLGQPKEWIKVGENAPYISPPGEVGATSEKYSKFFKRDGGTYQLGVVRQHMIEIFLDGEKLRGRFLLMFAPVNGQRRWLIDKPEDQTPYAEQRDLADTLAELKQKKQPFLIWSKPGEKPQKFDVETGRIIKSRVAIIKADPLKRIVYGVVLDPYGNDGPKPDAHNDWNPPSEIEKTAHEYLKHSRVVGLQHQKKANANVVESWVEQYPSREDYLKAMKFEDHKVYRRPFGTDKIHSGSWVLGVELGPEEWKAYQDGKLNAFSPGGYGIRRPIERTDMPSVTFIDLEERK